MNLDASELELEKNYLDVTTKEIKNQISSLGLELYEKEEKIKEFQKFIWDSRADMDDQEMKSMMGASELEITLAQNKSNHFKKLFGFVCCGMLGYVFWNFIYKSWISCLCYWF